MNSRSLDRLKKLNFAKRFEQEAQAMASLDHPAIISVFDFGETSDGQLYFVMEFIDGVEDYEAFIKKDRNRMWPKPDWKQKDDHPAVNVSWDDAVAFCVWLTERDRKKGKLGKDERYRLPTDHEWSCAVGIGREEDAEEIPPAKQSQIADIYPWGKKFSPPEGVGNYFEKMRAIEIDRKNRIEYRISNKE